MKRLFVAVFAIALAFSGSAALADDPKPIVNAAFVNCEDLSIEGTNLPANTTVDLTVIGASNGARFTEKLHTTPAGAVGASVRLRDVLPGKGVNTTYGVSIERGVTLLTISGCPNALPNTSTN